MWLSSHRQTYGFSPLIYNVLHMYYTLDGQPGTKIMIPGVLFINSILKFHRLSEPLQSDRLAAL